MSTTSTQPRQRLKLFLRGEPELGTEAVKQEIVDRLDDLRRAGHIDDYEIHVWGKSLRTDGPLAATDYQREILGHVREFQQWADRNGLALSRDFERRNVTSAFTDESYTVVSLPTLCLGVYEERELTGVYPCRDGGTTCSVMEFLESVGSDVTAPATSA